MRALGADGLDEPVAGEVTIQDDQPAGTERVGMGLDESSGQGLLAAAGRAYRGGEGAAGPAGHHDHRPQLRERAGVVLTPGAAEPRPVGWRVGQVDHEPVQGTHQQPVDVQARLPLVGQRTGHRLEQPLEQHRRYPGPPVADHPGGGHLPVTVPRQVRQVTDQPPHHLHVVRFRPQRQRQHEPHRQRRRHHPPPFGVADPGHPRYQVVDHTGG